jgi:hypothetical protein
MRRPRSPAWSGPDPWSKIAISEAAFEAIAKTLALGSVSFENATNEQGERYVWLEPRVVDRLRHLRGPGETYSDVILRIAGADVGCDEPAG